MYEITKRRRVKINLFLKRHERNKRDAKNDLTNKDYVDSK